MGSICLCLMVVIVTWIAVVGCVGGRGGLNANSQKQQSHNTHTHNNTKTEGQTRRPRVPAGYVCVCVCGGCCDVVLIGVRCCCDDVGASDASGESLVSHWIVWVIVLFRDSRMLQCLVIELVGYCIGWSLSWFGCLACFSGWLLHWLVTALVLLLCCFGCL